MKTFIHGVGLKDLPKEEADKIKARQSVTAPKKLDILRLERNRLLAETDFYALSDVTMTDNMKAYRQELRDITKKFQSMEQKDFKFPTKPTD
tara:strand:+ start:5397 stop:5672 length:276 start_codon:yes stop_codon:yes gene_type:complete